MEDMMMSGLSGEKNEDNTVKMMQRKVEAGAYIRQTKMKMGRDGLPHRGLPAGDRR